MQASLWPRRPATTEAFAVNVKRWVGPGLERVLLIFVYALMLVAILALWNNDAPPFIYVAF
jgi:hypothetical protein